MACSGQDWTRSVPEVFYNVNWNANLTGLDWTGLDRNTAMSVGKEEAYVARSCSAAGEPWSLGALKAWRCCTAASSATS